MPNWEIVSLSWHWHLVIKLIMDLLSADFASETVN